MSPTRKSVLALLQCRRLVVLLAIGIAFFPRSVPAQEPPSPTGAPPVVIPLTGTLTIPGGEPRTGSIQLTMSLYAEREDLAPQWVETQTVTVDSSGRYSVQFGAARASGIPPELFEAAGVRWVGVSVDGEPEGPRMVLLSVAYASKAATADSLGGRSAADFVLADNLGDAVRTALRSSTSSSASASHAPVAMETMALDGGGTANTIVKFLNGTGTIGDSVITESSGNIGLGTSTASHRFTVKGTSGSSLLSLMANSDATSGVGSGLAIETGAPSGNTYSQIYAWAAGGSSAANLVLNPNGGNIGIGTTTPSYRFTLKTGSGSRLLSLMANSDYGTGAGVGSGLAVEMGAPTGNTHAQMYAWKGGGSSAADLVFNPNGGNVAIGSSTPAARLHVAGTGFFDGDVTVNGNIAARFQDVAEWVDSVEPLDAGTVVVIDATAGNRVATASQAYDARVAGAISAQPGVVLGEPAAGRALVAQSGRVRIKVDARYGAIRPGDLLVSSPTKGHAMRSRPVNVGGHWMHRPGTLIGKALEALPAGRGEIVVLLTLQ